MDRSKRGRAARPTDSHAAAAQVARGHRTGPIPPAPPVKEVRAVTSTLSQTKAPLAVRYGNQPDAQTIVYVHGIGNKPSASVLKCQWDTALFGLEIGDRSRLAYWVSRERYPTPSDDSCFREDIAHLGATEGAAHNMAAEAATTSDWSDWLESQVGAIVEGEAQRDLLMRLAKRIQRPTQPPADQVAASDVGAKVLPLPAPARRWITERLTRAFLRDVSDYLFDRQRQEAMEARFTERLAAGGGPFVVIAHSQGSMIAYNVLRQLKKSDCDVRLFLTIGSPLGLTEVKDVLKAWTPDGVLRVPDCVAKWVNVADGWDFVAADATLANDYADGGRHVITDHAWVNQDSPINPHSGSGYLRVPAVQQVVRQTVGNAFVQAVARAIIAKDLVKDVEEGLAEERHRVLIQLAPREGEGTVESLGRALVKEIDTMVRATATSQASDPADEVKRAAVDKLKRFVAAQLTRSEIEQLRTRYKDLSIERVWRDSAKRALVYESVHTIQARPAVLGYDATGRGIGWAVLDTGINAGHPHFQLHGNVKAQWDCTDTGRPKEYRYTEHDKQTHTLDRHGHGTHVAGIIAGECRSVRVKDDRDRRVFAGVAPQTVLYGYKVLDDEGNGRDAWIIKALDAIAEYNESAGELAIAGINLSLGGNFDPSVYACGHTPLCQELRRLWGQGVLICLAAGNEGYALLQSARGDVPSNQDLSIGDPANLEEAIAVGSVHKTSPHTYGVSYFSSRGPTADGRRKPDLVAPGERILSALHTCEPVDRNEPLESRTFDASDLYIEMSGTSMAAPHVSGLLAGFLSVHREFIGYPDRVKRILLGNCIDLGRDPYIQGHGLPNLIGMLANT